MIAEAAASDYRPAACTTKRRDENAQNQQLPLDINDGPFPMTPTHKLFQTPVLSTEGPQIGPQKMVATL
jgi:hypothetical protein